MEFIDFRLRPPFGDFAGLPQFEVGPGVEAWRQSGLELTRSTAPSILARSMPHFLAEMDEAGISKAVVPGRSTAHRGSISDDTVSDLLDAYPERFIGFGSIGPGSGNYTKDVDRVVARGFAGVLFEPALFDPPRHAGDDVFADLFSALEEAGLILMLMASVYVGPDLSWSSPRHVQQVAERYPNLPIVVSHACWPHVEEFLGVAFRYPNVYALPDLYGNIPGLPAASAFAAAANTFLRHRTLFGSAYPARSLKASVEGFTAWDFADQETLELCAAGNAKRLLSISQ